MTTIETMICNALVTKALAIGYTVSVYDGEEFALKRCADKATIIAALGSTDHDALHFRNADGVKVGVVALIYGNGRDLISDHSDNAAINALVNSVNGT